MRAFILACAIAALFGSYGAKANLGKTSDAARSSPATLAINDAAELNAAQADVDLSHDTRSRPRRRLSASSILMTDGEEAVPADAVVRTRVRTCLGISVTITSFGGGDWDRGLDTFCDAADPDDPGKLSEDSR
jgi:hypothetical protein